MHLRRTVRTTVSLCLLVALVGAACSDEESTSTTTAAATTTASTTVAPTTTSPSTVDVRTNLESLSYLLQRLLTTKEIGNGWIDQGRNLVPPQSENLKAGGLCPAGEELLEPVGNRLNDLVMVTYRKDETPSTGVITEGLTWGPRAEIEANFAIIKAAHAACVGAPYETPNGDSQKLETLDLPVLGRDSFATRLVPGQPIADNPWMEVEAVMVLLSDPAVDTALIASVTYVTVHEPGGTSVSPDTAELERIARLAVDKNLTPP